jgi:hypothetical protein
LDIVEEARGNERDKARDIGGYGEGWIMGTIK